MTPQEYLELERAADVRHEFYKGQMYAMAGGSMRHALIITNLGRELSGALKKSPSRVVTQDLRTCVATEGLYTYPDIVIVCDKPRFIDKRSDTLMNPTVLIEILSHPPRPKTGASKPRSTERLRACRNTPSYLKPRLGWRSTGVTARNGS